MQGQDFLVRVNNHYFMQSSDGRQIAVTDTPSHAQHFASYREADGWCQRLRRRGYPMAVVTDVEARVMTHEVIRSLRATEVSAESLPASREELDSMPTGEYRRRYQSEPSFRERADQLESQPRQAVKARR